MNRPVCVKCGKEFRVKKAGVGTLVYANFGPYQLWDSDLWECPSCDFQIVGGFGSAPVSRCNDGDFQVCIDTWKKRAEIVEVH